MKARLYKGMFGGKVIELSGPAQTYIKVTGEKRMTRKQKYEYLSSQSFYDPYGSSLPQYEVRYVLTQHPHIAHQNNVTDPLSTGVSFMNMPCMHPDGSYFYEWDGNPPRRIR